ncbi:hypothetical protein CBF34_06145 [Vagococcus penaei]|uniref:CAAX prenyl protease 2/Lysostaphin resistance protein A-like domain-containing protein n=1 Tax=Vagococcus penaei TaxID=633807 RepID=A0A1Q2D6R7_9ENTE|nr:type II CAAX endopeptidase family protein [Vagococcus penaei]AQP54119.1 hypothetical protein BW732_07725 [Vagococcus penaei]RSU02117.1 hypothetical protein CBF34_06145 [Vagococcus penaei]
MSLGKIIKNVFILIGFFIVSQIPMTISSSLSFFTHKDMSLWVTSLIWFVWLVIFVGCAYWILSYYRKLSGDKSYRMTLKTIGTIIGFYILGRILLVVSTLLMNKVYGTATTENDAMLQSLFGPDSSSMMVLMLTISIAIGAPIFEELVFRGLPTAMFGKVLPQWALLIVTSLAFSTAHISGNIISFFMYFALGAIMYHVYRRRGMIIDSMLFHFLNNIFPAIILLMSYFFDLSMP